AEDLGRRDFTINAMAIDLNGDRVGRLEDPRGGREDLQSGVIRVLHGRSFVDDPTRLLRALRYEARFGFRMDEDTERLARERAAAKGPQLASTLRNELAPSAVHAVLSCEPPEALAMALARGAPGDQVLRYLADLRGVRLEITGHDLVEAGIPESPALGRALEETLRRKLDGELSARDEELATALALARGEDV